MQKGNNVTDKKPHKVRIALSPVFFGGLILIFGIWGDATVTADSSKSVERLIEETRKEAPPGSAADIRKKRLEQGEGYYRRYCQHCHGPEGRGKGNASPYLLPAPRNFHAGVFKFRSTRSLNLPLSKDLFRTIKNGLPGTAMPGWGEVLPDDVISALVEYIKTFSKRFQMERPEQDVNPGLEPPVDSLSLRKGESLYRELRCFRCHGDDGARTGPLKGQLKDHWGNLSLVYDINQPRFYKGGAAGLDIFRTLTTGMDGTAMGTYDFLRADERWHLTHFLQSRFKGEHIRLNETVDPGSLVTRKVDGLIDFSADHPIWQTVAPVRVALHSLRIRTAPASIVEVRSLRDTQSIAFHMEWSDPTPDKAFASAPFFLDAIALQFVEGEDQNGNVPFFGMGEQGKPVNIWHWRADAMQQVERGGKSTAGGEDEVIRLSLDPFRRSSVEELNAEGFGRLSVQSLEDQQVLGRGVWTGGRWRVVMVRSLKTPGPRDVQFEGADSMLLAVALWDGSAKDKNASKAVSLWQLLEMK